jgi:hypothetical protein
MEKIFYLVIATVCALTSQAQVLEVNRDWTSMIQTLDATSFVNSKLVFKVSASIKAVTNDSTAHALIWMNVQDKEGKYLFGKACDKVTSPEWCTYFLEGEATGKPHKITLAISCSKDGKFYFDDFEFSVQDKHGNYRKVPLNNPDFELPVSNNNVPYWKEGYTDKFSERVKSYTISSNKDHTSGKLSLLIEGKNTVKDSTYLIGPAKGFTPQIGALAAMLNNMTSRVERDVIALNLEEADYLLDEKANTIGALIMHLAAAEVYYQVLTFEHREFNEEEKKKWQVALDLGEEARQTIKGHSIEYYLNIYREVRKKTLEEFRKRNDEWLYELLSPDSDTNNYWAWFHMAEHQSSHLGQMRMVKKRLPERSEKLESVKIEMDH